MKYSVFIFKMYMLEVKCKRGHACPNFASENKDIIQFNSIQFNGETRYKRQFKTYCFDMYM